MSRVFVAYELDNDASSSDFLIERVKSNVRTPRAFYKEGLLSGDRSERGLGSEPPARGPTEGGGCFPGLGDKGATSETLPSYKYFTEMHAYWLLANSML